MKIPFFLFLMFILLPINFVYVVFRELGLCSKYVPKDPVAALFMPSDKDEG